MIVMKFGGTSVGSADAIKKTGQIVKRAREKGDVVVVVSALTRVTDQLIAMAEDARCRRRSPGDMLGPVIQRHTDVCRELGLDEGPLLEPLELLSEVIPGIYNLRELTPRSRDFVLTFGEVLSSRIVAAHLASIGVPAHAVSGWDAGILTDDNHGSAALLPASWERIPQCLAAFGSTPVVTGFIGQTMDGERTTLGRGGSDYTAAILGRALHASEIQIWTDVNGILSADPRVCKDAFTLPELTFEEAAELAFFGAKVIHPKTIEPAVMDGIPVRVLNTFEPDHAGTIIVKGPRQTVRQVVGLATKRGNLVLALDSTRMLDADGFLATVFAVLKRHRISVDTISTSEVSVCMTIEKRFGDVLEKAAAELREVAHVELRDGRAIICCVGLGMRERPGTAGRIFTAVHQAGINVEMISMGSSKINITFVVKDDEADRCMQELHAKLVAAAWTPDA